MQAVLFGSLLPWPLTLSPCLPLCIYPVFVQHAAHAAALLVDFIVYNYSERANMAPCSHVPPKQLSSFEMCREGRREEERDFFFFFFPNYSSQLVNEPRQHVISSDVVSHPSSVAAEASVRRRVAMEWEDVQSVSTVTNLSEGGEAGG